MVFIVKSKVTKELKSYLYKPTPFKAVIPISSTSNYIFVTAFLHLLYWDRAPGTQFYYHTAHQAAYLCSSNATHGLPRNTPAPLPWESIPGLPGWRNAIKDFVTYYF